MPKMKFNDFNALQGFYKKPDQSTGTAGCLFTFGPITGSEPQYKKLKEKMTELGKAGQANYIEMSYEVGKKADLQRKYPGKVTGLKLFAGNKEVKFL